MEKTSKHARTGLLVAFAAIVSASAAAAEMRAFLGAIGAEGWGKL